MEDLKINLTIFLDALSWGDVACISNATVRYARTGLMKSEELPLILRHWWKPPRAPGSNNRRPLGATVVMENFAHECSTKVMDRELEKSAGLFKSPAGDDVTEEQLTGTVFNETIHEVKKKSPHLWSLLYRLSWDQGEHRRWPYSLSSHPCAILT